MKKPIAEFLHITIQSGAELARRQHDHEAWQILRRKQGYVTHRLYQTADEPLRWLIYSEWESHKALAGARQYLQTTPLMRRARLLLSAPPQQLIVEIGGRTASTKGIQLPEGAVGTVALMHLPNDGDPWPSLEEKLWRTLSDQPGHLGNITFHAVHDPLMAGSFSHWSDRAAFQKARHCFDNLAAVADAHSVASPVEIVIYTSLRDLQPPTR
jgi:quinol monooxygenase YgiN